MHDITNMRELVAYYLRLIYEAERELSQTLPKIKNEINSPALKEFISAEVDEKKKQQMRLEMLFVLLKEEPSATCSDDIVKYLISTNSVLREKYGSNDASDHMTITLYQALINYIVNIHKEAIKCSDALGYDVISRMLKRSLEEERKLSQKLEYLEKAYAPKEQDPSLYR